MRGSRLLIFALLLVGIVVLRRRRVYRVPGVGRVLKASDQEHEYWRGKYEEWFS